jgi:hypothetical protein
VIYLFLGNLIVLKPSPLKKTDDDKTKAEILAKYFSSVFTEEPEGDIPNPKPINIKEKMPELMLSDNLF